MSEVLSQLSQAGVAIWLDDLSRDRLRTGNLAALVKDKHVVGVTTNPSIFEKALSEGTAYDDQVRDLSLRKLGVDEAVRSVTTFDVRWACDVLEGVYDATDGLDGRVSIEVDPRLAHDTDTTTAEAKALWWLVDRPNLFIKIPATREGIKAIEDTLAQGISVNVTLIFSLQRYTDVMNAYLAGLERAKADGKDLHGITSVASFFVSRVDTEIDKRLDKLGTDDAKALRGKAAIANARLAYEAYEKVFSSDRWKALEAAGARPQRPLWASTGVKDPAYDDTQYVVELVAAGTVNTMPEPTLNAVVDHGVFKGDTVTGTYDTARELLAGLEKLGISYDEVVEQLEVEGVQKFEQSWQNLGERMAEQLKAKGTSA
ncbi:MAG: transaldolase [Frankiaceae bacterium]|jgi:transaldolase|nr:transaldolase [Frankiaceae bacterium]